MKRFPAPFSTKAQKTQNAINAEHSDSSTISNGTDDSSSTVKLRDAPSMNNIAFNYTTEEDGRCFPFEHFNTWMRLNENNSIGYRIPVLPKYAIEAKATNCVLKLFKAKCPYVTITYFKFTEKHMTFVTEGYPWSAKLHDRFLYTIRTKLFYQMDDFFRLHDPEERQRNWDNI